MDWLLEGWKWVTERETLLAWIGGLSFLTVVVSAAIVPIVIRGMPHDYFLENSQATEKLRRSHPVLRGAFLVVKNLVGGILVLGGLIMLITPGQGLLTMIIGLMLMNFPGKRRLEIRLIRTRFLNRAVDWIRRKGGRPPLLLPEP